MSRGLGRCLSGHPGVLCTEPRASAQSAPSKNTNACLSKVGMGVWREAARGQARPSAACPGKQRPAAWASSREAMWGTHRLCSIWGDVWKRQVPGGLSGEDSQGGSRACRGAGAGVGRTVCRSPGRRADGGVRQVWGLTTRPRPGSSRSWFPRTPGKGDGSDLWVQEQFRMRWSGWENVQFCGCHGFSPVAMGSADS